MGEQLPTMVTSLSASWHPVSFIGIAFSGYSRQTPGDSSHPQHILTGVEGGKRDILQNVSSR